MGRVSILPAEVKDASGGSTIDYPPMTNDLHTMGERIRMLRDAKGFTQDQLADLCGVSREAVSQWENGKTANIKLVPFLKLVEALGTSQEYLVHGPDERPRGGTNRKRPRVSGTDNGA